MDPRIYEHIMELSKAITIYDKFCERKKCPEYHEWTWDYDGSPCKSCEKVGASYQIEKFPDDCLHKEEIERETVIVRLKGKRRVL